MNLRTILKKYPTYFYALLVITSIVNSIWSVALLALMNNTITGTKLPFADKYAWQVYVALIVTSFFMKRLFQMKMLKISREIMFEMNMEMLRKIRQIKYRKFENLGQNRIYTALGDIVSLQSAPSKVVTLINSIIIFVSSFGYLIFVSPLGALVIGFLLTILALFYYFRNQNIEQEMLELRDMQNDFHLYLADLLRGNKDLKMDDRAGENLLESFIKNNREQLRFRSLKVGVKYMNNDLLGNYFWYILIGVALFGLPSLGLIASIQLAPFILTLLYLIEPTNSLIGLIPVFTGIRVASKRLEELNEELVDELESAMDNPPQWLYEEFDSLRFESVCFKYQDEEKNSEFVLGPISFEIKKGEVIFFTGGNGSGKSTLLKIAAGLYYPNSGDIFFNGNKISHSITPHYRKLISAVFPDGHLFSGNYRGYNFKSQKDRTKEILETLRMEDKTKFDVDKNWFEHDFSTGQSKRMALFYALMKDNEILFLDEWAAEQDPEFREYFYEKLIPMLNENHTVILVSHDSDHIPSNARVIHFEFGSISQKYQQKKLTNQE